MMKYILILALAILVNTTFAKHHSLLRRRLTGKHTAVDAMGILNKLAEKNKAEVNINAHGLFNSIKDILKTNSGYDAYVVVINVTGKAVEFEACPTNQADLNSMGCSPYTLEAGKVVLAGKPNCYTTDQDIMIKIDSEEFTTIHGG